MTRILGFLGGLGVASLLVDAAIWIHRSAMVQHNEEICHILQQRYEAIVSDLNRTGIPFRDRAPAQNVFPQLIDALKVDTLIRARDLNVYCNGLWGITLASFLLAFTAWHRHRALDHSRQLVVSGRCAQGRIRAWEDEPGVSANTVTIREGKEPC